MIVRSLVFGLIAVLLVAQAASGQATFSAPVAAKVQAALALVECTNGSERSYLAGVVIASNELRSYIAIPTNTRRPGRDQFRNCHAPLVHFSDSLARGYPGQTVAPNIGSRFLVVSSDVILAADHPVAHVATFASAAPQNAQSIALLGYDAQPAAAGTLPKLTRVPETLQTGFSLNADISFSSAANVDSAVVIDPASGDVFGVAASIGDASEPQRPSARRFQLAGPTALTSLLAGMLEPIAPGIGHLTAPQLAAERVASAAALPLFLRWPNEAKGEYAGFAVVLGATATSTILISPSMRAVTHTSAGDPFLEVHDRDGSIRMVHATPITIDPGTDTTFLSVPKLDVAIPTFGSPPPPQTTVALPQIFGFSCTWTAPSPRPEDCPQRVYSVPVLPPPEGSPSAIGLTTNLDQSYYSPGAPVIDAHGWIVALANAAGWANTMPLVALKLEPLHVGIKIAIHP